VAFGTAAILGLGLLAAHASAQMPLPRQRPPAAPPSDVSVDGSQAMFTTMCALLASGFESDVSAENWHPLRARVRE